MPGVARNASRMALTAEETAVFYYPEDAVVHLEGEFTVRQLQALCEAMQHATR